MKISLMSFRRGLSALCAVGMLGVGFAVGCGAQEEYNEAGGNPSSCPDSYPDAQDCSTEGESCTYAGEGCALDYTCLNGAFVLEASKCIIACDEMPSEYSWVEVNFRIACANIGDLCTVWGSCSFAMWKCGSDHVWQFSSADEYPCDYECDW